MSNEHAWGTRSRTRLASCHPILQQIADEALATSPYDMTIIHGWRGEEVQNELCDSGASTKRFPDSRHNRSDDPAVVSPETVSDALDFGPYVNGRIPWDDPVIFAVIAGCFFAAAERRGYRIRWGGDWDTDGSTTDQTLMDYGHIEMIW